MTAFELRATQGLDFLHRLKFSVSLSLDRSRDMSGRRSSEERTFVVGVVSLLLFVATGVALLVWNRNCHGGAPGAPSIVGRWHQDEPTFCSVTYPREVEFFPDQIYTVSGARIWWNGGAYAVVDRGRLRMETRDGPDIYRVRVEARRLTLTNSSGCTIVYYRLPVR